MYANEQDRENERTAAVAQYHLYSFWRAWVEAGVRAS